MNTDLFNNQLPITKLKTFKDYVLTRDKKGAIDYLRRLKQTELFKEVIREGFSMIGFHHGKSLVIEHVIKQM